LNLEYLSPIDFPLSLKIAFALTKIDPKSVEHLRHIFRCWKKRNRGEPLDFEAHEDQWAEEFQEMLDKALDTEDRGFLFRLDSVFNSSRPQKLQLREAVLLAWSDLCKSSPTWEQIRQQVETVYKIDRRPSTWRKLRKTRPFCDYF
jgi:hypothetical protein